MSNYGAKPTGISSPAAIVRYGFNARLRMLVAKREPNTMAALAVNYDRGVVDEICAICDRLAARQAA